MINHLHLIIAQNQIKADKIQINQLKETNTHIIILQLLLPITRKGSFTLNKSITKLAAEFKYKWGEAHHCYIIVA